MRRKHKVKREEEMLQREQLKRKATLELCVTGTMIDTHTHEGTSPPPPGIFKLKLLACSGVSFLGVPSGGV